MSNTPTIQEILKEFDEKFPSEEILEAVDIGEGQGDVVPVGEEFRKVPNPQEIKAFIHLSHTSLLEKIIEELAVEKKNDKEFKVGSDDAELHFKGGLKGFNQAIDRAVEIVSKY